MVVIDEATQATEPATLVPLTQVCAAAGRFRLQHGSRPAASAYHHAACQLSVL